jgi:hypothetical protein
MRIGIDFDNTIACYDEAFSVIAQKIGLLQTLLPSKTAVRDAVRAMENGEYQWQRLQGLVYGKYILRAKLFEGVRKFFLQAKAKAAVDLFIISHKTELAHHDPEYTDLRDAARGFLAHHGFFDALGFKQKNLFFESTREEKIQRIHTTRCDVFIDDLPEILLDDSFPHSCQKILFSPSPHEGLTHAHSWNMLSSLILR